MGTPIFDMLVRSGWMGRAIILLLVVFSLVTWTIVFSRYFSLNKIRTSNSRFKRKFGSFGSILEIENVDKQLLRSPMGQLGKVGHGEYSRIISDAQSHTAVKDWSFFIQNQFTMASEHLESALSAVMASFDKGVFLLAMISSIAPFLGLLGTVWGIMNSFYEIGNQGSASLPVVAPGIAEALITTIVGIAVAIPALFFYNFFNHQVEKIENEMDEFKELLMVRLKRDIFELLYTEQQPSRGPIQAKRF